MTATRSLDLAIELAIQRRDAVVRKLAANQQALAHAQLQLAQLSDYVAETDARIVQSVNRPVSMEVLRHHYQFMGRLQDAIRLQTDAVQRAQRQLNGVRAELSKVETAVLGLTKVRDARLVQVRQALGRREQAASDELATQLHLRRARTLSEGAHPWQ